MEVETLIDDANTPAVWVLEASYEVGKDEDHLFYRWGGWASICQDGLLTSKPQRKVSALSFALWPHYQQQRKKKKHACGFFQAHCFHPYTLLYFLIIIKYILTIEFAILTILKYTVWWCWVYSYCATNILTVHLAKVKVFFFNPLNNIPPHLSPLKLLFLWNWQLVGASICEVFVAALFLVGSFMLYLVQQFPIPLKHSIL